MEFAPNKIYQGDCVDIMNRMPEKCVDLIFADPPYNLQLQHNLHRPNNSQVDAVDDDWDQFGSFAEYDAFTRSWLSACRRVLKDTGTLWVIGSYHNIYRVGAILQDLGYWLLNDVVWVKTNPMPQFRGVRFCNAHETMLWASKHQKQRYTFNYQALKSVNDDLQVRSDWYLPLCTGPERLRGEGGKLHSTQKPEALLHRIIRACSEPGNLVLDPFFGSGTTGAVAKRLGRQYIGIEREGAYIAAAQERIEMVQQAPPDALDYPQAPARRVPFSALLELGLLEEGAKLRLQKTKTYATVLANGVLESGEGARGSIHRLGAALLGCATCNGWDHWYYLDQETGAWVEIDVLRQRARALLHIDR